MSKSENNTSGDMSKTAREIDTSCASVDSVNISSRPSWDQLLADCEAFYRRNMPLTVEESRIKSAAERLAADINRKWEAADVESLNSKYE
jgi:hypothetical protein